MNPLLKSKILIPLAIGGVAGYALSHPKTRQNINYGKYLGVHKYNIIGPMRSMGLGYGQALKHDLSKLTPTEFGPYRDWFEGPKGIKGSRDPETFKTWRTAVYHHKHAPDNLHHYRALGLKDTPLKYKLEAVADWYSVGKTKGRVREPFPSWYTRVREKLPIDKETKMEIDKHLGLEKQAFPEVSMAIQSARALSDITSNKAKHILSKVKGHPTVVRARGSKVYREIKNINEWGKAQHPFTRKLIIPSYVVPVPGTSEVAIGLHGGLSAGTYYASKAYNASPKAKTIIDTLSRIK